MEPRKVLEIDTEDTETEEEPVNKEKDKTHKIHSMIRELIKSFDTLFRVMTCGVFDTILTRGS